ncbi:MAG: hypothetical protein IJ349_07845 [Clostridia bacterium]|nr:hypothetical protein [Clostridia bacterium]
MWLRGFATTSCERCSAAQWAAFLLYFYFSELLILRSTALAFLLRFCFCAVVVAFSFYCPVRAALTFVGCDKSKQKRAFVPVSFYERVRSGGEIFLLLPLSEIILR